MTTTLLRGGLTLDHPPTSVNADELEAMRPYATSSNVLELGSHFGGSTVALARLACRVCSVDWHRGDATINSQAGSRREFLFNLASYGVADRVCVHEGRFEDLLPRGLHGTPYDLVFLDGEHLAKSVERDLGLIWSYVDTKIIACHDYGLYQTQEGIEHAMRHAPAGWKLSRVVRTLAILMQEVHHAEALEGVP